ncbi:hypothetical protein IT072_11860 [Leifsonia sp. ZF2019]|uniref:hypothetical protein n=1 Tax=Leifsonia sp. ZF2019 TaxID=2781978 RepID=UPI001CC14849|nr:hypothetical protein [Leifsonia sp. ZF2019]UAJ77984.1 hypothetical protein IT072_11860 [Leifsonia sp. ZF2019]
MSATFEEGVSGTGYGWSVDVVLSGDEPVTPEELSALLLAARRAGDRDPTLIDLFATSPSGASLDLTSPADDLGVRYAEVGARIGVVRSAIDDALGARGAPRWCWTRASPGGSGAPPCEHVKAPRG